MQNLLLLLILFLCYSITLKCQIKDEKIANKTEITQRLQANQFYFLENKGQWDDKVLFMAQSKSLRTWITKNSIVFEQFEKRNAEDFKYLDKYEPKPIKAHAVGLEFVNPANVNAKKGEAGSTKFNFIIGNDKSKHKSGVLQYSEVSIENIYEGIDMRYYFDNGELRYDFIVKPGANPDLIEMEIKGSDNFYIKDGDVVMETSLKPVTQKGLNAYQDKKQKKVDCKFKIKGNKLKFELGEYDKGKELVIDPLARIKSWSASSGASDLGIQLDSYGHLYFIGYIDDPTFNTTIGAYDRTYNGNVDVIIGRLGEDTWGDHFNLLWATYFGAEGTDRARGLEIDEDYVYISGWTDSDSLPLRNEIQTYQGGRDGFFAVLDIDGENLIYSTYYGTDGNDMFNSMAMYQENKNVFLVGMTDNPGEFPLYKEVSTQNYENFYSQGVIVGLIPYTDQNGLHYDTLVSSLFGGDRVSMVSDVDIGPNIMMYLNTIYITGETASDSASFAITPLSYRTNNYNNDKLVFISKLHLDAVTDELVIDYNTYFAKCLIDFDTYQVLPVKYAFRNFIFGGCTNNSNLPLKNAFDGYYSADSNKVEAFLAVINIDDAYGEESLVYSSYFGGNNASAIKDIDFISIDGGCNKIIFTGVTEAALPNFNNLYENFLNGVNNHMVGIINTENENIGTLTDLAYIHIGTYNYGNSVKHLNGSNNFIYTAGHGGTEQGNAMTVFKLETDTEICTCPCDPDQDWLIVSKVKQNDSCDNEAQCRLTLEFFIHETFYRQCYKYYQYFDGIELSQKIPIPETWPFVITEKCINAGSDYNFTLYLFKSFNDTISCTIQRTISCACDCPETIQDWINVDIVKGGGDCTDDECNISYNWNIPPGYECFNHYILNNDSIKIFDVNNPPTLNIDSCIDEGMNYTIIIKLMKGISDLDTCTIIKNMMCSLIEDAQPCEPDTCDSLWIPQKPLTIPILTGDCAGCYLNINYWSRISCPPENWQDIQITKIEKINFNPDSISSICDDREIYSIALDAVISANEMGFEPLYDENPLTDSCSSLWRVSKASCWSKFKDDIIQISPFSHYTVYKPCNSDCCVRQIEVCRYSADSVEITDLGLMSDSLICDSSSYPIGAEPFSYWTDCAFSCDLIDDIADSIYHGKIPEEIQYKIKKIIENKFQSSEIYYRMNVTNNQSTLKIKIDETNANNIKINIFNLNGELLITNSKLINSGYNLFEIDISKIVSGTYLYSIEFNSIKAEYGKLIIIR
ncbi:MAG: hypothetical protein V1779_10940 [bacterium]